MTEREEAVILAQRLLDEPNADPDDDLRCCRVSSCVRWRKWDD